MRDQSDKKEVNELTREFIAESMAGLERMELCLTELEMRPDEEELVSEIFRAVHTIKGTTGFLGFGRLEKLAHSGESLLGALRDKKLKVSSDLINGLLKLLDGLRAILQLIEATGMEGERAEDHDSDLIAHLEELKIRGMQSLQSRKSPVQEQKLKPQDSAPRQALVVSPTENSLLTNYSSGDSSSGKDWAITIDGITTGECASAENSTSQQQKKQQRTDGTAATGVSSELLRPDPSLRIDVEVLNQLMNQVGELVLTRNQILRCTPDTKNFHELAGRLDSVTAELRQSVMQARMQPVGHLFSKFPRMVRDLGITCGRRVRIVFDGQETRLDKSLLEAVRDPLTHAVRNAVDHGIEPPSERVKAGKPVEGVVCLRAYHQSGSVVIEVIDDGAGISTERVLEKAMERGLVTPRAAATMSQREALQLIFVAGFSTAKIVTNVSGRGVGMDVVRSNVEKVGGRVELESRVGSGTTVRMRVPLTLAIIPALVVRSGGQSFALPQNALTELIYLSQREAETAVEQIGTTEVYRLREHLLPLIWLDRLLNLEHEVGKQEDGFYIAVLEAEGRRYGLVVDDLKAPEEIVVKPLSPDLREIGVFSGATVLGDGVLALILDVAATGARAGVRPIAVEEINITSADPEPAESAPVGMEDSLVIYELGKRGLGESANSERMAMPLSAVERIESVPLRNIEYAEGRAMLQYCGELLALEDEGELLPELHAANRSAAPDAPQKAATVLICLRPGARGVRRMGIVVRRVLDVSAGTLLAADSAECDGQLAMVNQRVSTVHSEFTQRGGLPVSTMQEVA
ncbi:MAG: chemotaxis protein CheA [Acidobacteriaceae bacterium]|nr:chemotaxis protein CheA [Acidobacteriaceae bacterium]